MKTVIVYASKKGFIKEAAEKLKDKLAGETDLIDLFRQKPGDLTSYDVIVLASSVRMGRFYGKFRKLCETRIPRLKDKKIVLLMGGLDETGYEETAARNISEENRRSLWKTVYAGGRYKPEQFNRFMRNMLGKVLEESGVLHREKWENLDSLAIDINSL